MPPATSSARIARRRTRAGTARPDPPSASTSAPTASFLVSGDATGSVFVYDWKTCKVYEQLKADATGGAVTCVLWHPQETSKVATAGVQGDIKFWD